MSTFTNCNLRLQVEYIISSSVAVEIPGMDQIIVHLCVLNPINIQHFIGFVLRMHWEIPQTSFCIEFSRWADQICIFHIYIIWNICLLYIFSVELYREKSSDVINVVINCIYMKTQFFSLLLVLSIISNFY